MEVIREELAYHNDGTISMPSYSSFAFLEALPILNQAKKIRGLQYLKTKLVLGNILPKLVKP
jgi:hypothetical protein